MEHTWGVSIFHFGKEQNADWSNSDFHNVQQSGNKVYTYIYIYSDRCS